MSRYERMQFFETLCQLQARYAARTAVDRRSELSIDDAVTYAEAVMFAIGEGEEEARAFDEYVASQETRALSETSGE